MVETTTLSRAPEPAAGASLHERLAFERLIAELSANFVHLQSHRLDAAIDHALEAIALFLDVERAATLEFSQDGSRLTPTHAWVAPGTPAFPTSDFANDSHPWIQGELREGRTVALSHLDDLPPKAQDDRALLTKLQIRSFVALPLAVAGTQLGALGFVSNRREVDWSDALLRRLRLMSEVFANALARRVETAQRERRLALEQLVAGLSATFVNLPAEAIDRHLELALERASRFLKVDRSTIFQFNEATGQLEVTHTWVAPGHTLVSSAFRENTYPYLEEQGLKGEIVAFAEPADLPKRAHVDRRRFEENGVQSCATVPFAIGGAPLGVVSFTTVSSRIDWTTETLTSLRQITNVFANAIARSRSEQELARRSRFDSLLADISASFVKSAPEDLDEQIESGLKRISVFLGVDRSSIFQFSSDHTELRPTHSWRTDGAASSPTKVRAEIFGWLKDRSERGEILAFSGPGDLPPDADEEARFFESLGVASFATVPLIVSGSPIGSVSFLTVERKIHWTPEVQQRLRLIGEVFASAIARQGSAARLDQRLRFEDLLLELSAKMTHLPTADIGPEIDRGLEAVADYVHVEQACFAEFDPNGESLVVSHCFSRPGIVDLVGSDLHETFPPYAEMLRRGEQIRMERLASNSAISAYIDGLPPDGDRPRSHAALPIVTGGSVFGVLGLSSFERSHAWPDDQINRLELIGRIFSSALARKRSSVDLQAAYDKIRDLNERLEAENIYLREELTPRPAEGIVGQSAVLRQVLRQVERVGTTDTTVLLTGETGTGKELVAEAIHAMSHRRERAMVRVNCAALPATLIESELFGREKGAFTGATARQAGRFEAADRSTLFLDEIAELPLETQAKLLRVLEEGRFERLGSARTLEVDVRIVAATNRDLEAEVADGRFREDLFYRLDVFPIQVPPLRERREDIPLLVWAFARDYAERLGKKIESVSKANMDQMQNYAWPGNVRELRNVVERAVILSDGSTLEIQMRGPKGARSAGRTSLDDVQADHIRSVLTQTRWRVRGESGAAAILGLKPTTLEYRMKRLGIQRPGHDGATGSAETDESGQST